MERPAEGQIVREGKEEKRSNSVGCQLLGCEDKSYHKDCPKQGRGRAPSALLWVLPLKKCAPWLPAKMHGSRSVVDQSAHLPGSS